MFFMNLVLFDVVHIPGEAPGRFFVNEELVFCLDLSVLVREP